jgi:two-component system phosphate regulon sensor histidine kinase PhoR
MWTETNLRPDLEQQAALRLGSLARVIADDAGAGTLEDSLADRLGALAGVRVTFVAGDGTVLGDSEVPATRLARLDNHGARSEIVQARSEGLGLSSRGSRSVSLPLFYVAVRRGEDFVRLAVPIATVTGAVGQVRRMAVLLAVVALILLVAAPRAARNDLPRADLRLAVRGLGAGRFDTRVPDDGPLADIAGELNEAARALALDRGRTKEHLEDLERMLDAIDDGVAVVDASGRVVRGNLAFTRWAGVEEPAGRRIGTLFRHPVPRRAVEAALSGESSVAEAILGSRTVEVRTVPVADGALLRIHDLTRTRRLEGMRRDFVANVSHELKTPLTSIRGFAEPLLEPGVEATQASEFVRRILANADRMQYLVDDLLDLTRIESGSWEPDLRGVDVGETARRVWDRMEAVADARSVALSVLGYSDQPGADVSPCAVRADPHALEQVLANLFDNAVRYSPVGAEITVRCVSVDDGRAVRVEVRDEGPGIASEHVGRVFERFYRVDAGRSRDSGGTGLGLSIVKHLVVALEGRVGVDSELGRGTTVWFELPAPGDTRA